MRCGLNEISASLGIGEKKNSIFVSFERIEFCRRGLIPFHVESIFILLLIVKEKESLKGLRKYTLQKESKYLFHLCDENIHPFLFF